MSKALSELNALCDALSCMRTIKGFISTKQMYKHFCKPGTGTIDVRYIKTSGKGFLVQFEYITRLGAVSRLQIDTTKYY